MHKILIVILCLFGSIVYANEPIHSNNYNDAILLSKTIEHKVLLIFSADWCVNCQVLKNDLIKHNDLHDIIICTVDIDHSPDIARSFKIRKIPVSIILDNNQEKSRYIGYKQYTEYLLWIKNSGGL